MDLSNDTEANHGFFRSEILIGGLEPWNFMTFHSVGKNHYDSLHHFSEG